MNLNLSHMQKGLTAKWARHFLTIALLWGVATPIVSVRAAQEPQMPGMQMPPGQTATEHPSMKKPAARAFPRFRQAQRDAHEKLFTLEEAQEIAREKNPTLRQAEAGIKAARAREQQAGLLPNPVVGYSGDEIRGGETGGGKQGFFVEQRIIMGGKLDKARAVFAKEASPGFAPYISMVSGFSLAMSMTSGTAICMR